MKNWSKIVALLFAMMLCSVAYGANQEKEVNVEDVNESIECYGCQLFVTAIDNYLQSNKSITGLEQYALEACQYLGSYKTICEDEVPQVVPVLVEYLEKELTPLEICEELNICTSNSTLEDDSYCMAVIEISPCDICESAMSFVDDYIEQDSIQTKFESVFTEECSKVFSNHQGACAELSSYLVPKVTEMITSVHICNDIGMCNNEEE